MAVALGLWNKSNHFKSSHLKQSLTATEVSVSPQVKCTVARTNGIKPSEVSLPIVENVAIMDPLCFRLREVQAQVKGYFERTTLFTWLGRGSISACEGGP